MYPAFDWSCCAPGQHGFGYEVSFRVFAFGTGPELMRHINYYLIEPRPEAITRFRDCGDPELAGLLLEPLLISNTESDRSGWRPEDHALRVKLLYLARIREYVPFVSDEDARQWFGCDRVSGAVFDQWWTIRMLEFEGSDSELSDYLKSMKEKILPTGNSLVDEWVLWATNARQHPETDE